MGGGGVGGSGSPPQPSRVSGVALVTLKHRWLLSKHWESIWLSYTNNHTQPIGYTEEELGKIDSLIVTEVCIDFKNIGRTETLND